MKKILAILLVFLILLSCKDELKPSKEDSVILIAASTGLATSLPIAGEIFKKWARDQVRRVEELNDPRIETMILSSDLKEIETLKTRVVSLIKEDRLHKLIILAHSNGFRDALVFSEWLNRKFPEKKIDYLAGIDMTLAPQGAQVYCNILEFDEFHAIYRYAEFHPSCSKDRMDYELFEMRMGHTAAANDKFTQDLMFSEILKRVKGGS